MFVKDYMTPNPITVSPEDNFPQAISAIRKRKIRHLPVLEGDKLVGIIVEKDLLSNQPSPATVLSIYEIYSLLETLRVRQIMSHPVIAVEGDCPIEEAARIMVEKKISCLPVMDGKNLIGIITETDVFRVLVEVLGGDENGFRFTLRLAEQVGELANVSGKIAQAGGNIVAVTSSSILDDGRREVVIKEYGANPETVTQAIKDLKAEILDIRPSSRYQPRIFE